MLRRFHVVVATTIIALNLARAEQARGTDNAAVVALLEDNASELLPKLTNPQGGIGEGFAEMSVVYSGKSAVRIVPEQRYARSIAGWDYRIAERPKLGEYRYLRFAWRATACSGIMLQLHDDHDWTMRLTAGADKYSWGTKFVAAKPPADWTVVNVDLFQMFGQRTIRGMALTCFDGKAGYFDHIYVGRSVADLDHVDATDFAMRKRNWSGSELAIAWDDATATDAAAAYRGFWSLANAPNAAEFLAAKLKSVETAPEAGSLERWIAELDADDYAVRQAASANLTPHVRAAADLLDAELKRTDSAEVKARIKSLLKQTRSGIAADERQIRVVRILEYSSHAEAQAALREIAVGPKADRIAQEARDALTRREAYAASR